VLKPAEAIEKLGHAIYYLIRTRPFYDFADDQAIELLRASMRRVVYGGYTL
jgi:hypothetical protein